MAGFRRGFAPGRAEQLIVPMQKAERWTFYRKNLEMFRRAAAVFAVSDAYAVDLLGFLAEEGLSVPEDISVAGFDDTPVCEMLRPALTTVRQDGALRAKLAVEALRELKEGHAVETEITLPVSLIVRKSTAERKEAYRSGERLLVYGAVGAFLLSAAVVLLREPYVDIYRVDGAVKAMTRQILLAYAIIAPCKVLNMILGGGILRSGGRTTYIMAIDMAGTWCLGVPLGLLSAFVWKLSIPYVYFILSLDECFRLAVSLAVFRRRSWMDRLGSGAE